MLSLYDRVSMERALDLPLAPKLRELLAQRIGHTYEHGLTELTHFLVVEAGDEEPTIMDEIGLSPLVNPIDDARFGEATFHPFWDWLKDVGGWFEMIVSVGDGGFAFVLLIEDAEGVDPELLDLCHSHS